MNPKIEQIHLTVRVRKKVVDDDLICNFIFSETIYPTIISDLEST